ncbi:MAG: hypothetical protein Q9195_005665 [Heterodermia aff. obscurata]
MDILSIGTSFISIVSCTYTITLLTREWRRRVEFTKELSGVHQGDIEVLQLVIQECREIANSSTQISSSVEESFRNCAAKEKKLLDVLEPWRGTSSKLAETVRLSLLKKDLKRRYGMFRESVLLLRDLCSELRTQQQLVDMSAGMARLASDFVDEDNEIDENEHVQSAAIVKGSNKPHTRLIGALEQLGSSNYVIKATVVVENPCQERGQRFRYISTEAEHTPALVKLDTGSDVDVVSHEFLAEAGFPANAFMPIPEEAKDSFIGIEGTPYRPESTVELFWFREGEQRMRKSRFYAVSGAPVDMLLGSKRFAQEAVKRVALFTGPPKSKATLELEKKREAERLEEAKQAEEVRFQEELERRQARARRIFPTTSIAMPDVEQVSSTSASSQPRSGN